MSPLPRPEWLLLGRIEGCPTKLAWTERLDALGKDVGLDISDAQLNDYPGRVIARVLEGGPEQCAGHVVNVPQIFEPLGLGD